MATREEKARHEANEIIRIAESSVNTMLRKNEERGNCSGDVGLLGLFLETRTMYLRLRNLVWDKGPPPVKTEEYLNWKVAVQNALEDCRNYTILAEIALKNDNLKGDGDDSELEAKTVQASR